MAQYDAYWIEPSGKIVQIGVTDHITAVVKSPAKFGLTKESIAKVYEKYGEQVGRDGEAREELIRNLVGKGWIRIRFYGRFWSVTLERWTRREKAVLSKWAELAEKYRFSGPHSPVKVLVLKTDKMFSFTVTELKFGMTESINEKVDNPEEDMNNHDVAVITAFRDSRDCGEGKEYTRSENLTRNKQLLTGIKSLGYDVVKSDGGFIENLKAKKEDQKVVLEPGFFVVDRKGSGKLVADMRKLGFKYDQDAVMFIDKGTNKGYFIGTNKCPKAHPGFGKRDNVGRVKWGKTGTYFTKVKGKTFVVEAEELSTVAGLYSLQEYAELRD